MMAANKILHAEYLWCVCVWACVKLSQVEFSILFVPSYNYL